MHTRHHCDDAEGLLPIPRRVHAVVVGGSLAGMLAARVLSHHFDVVTLLERDQFPEMPAGRKGLPQGRHAHALLKRGRAVLERFLPGMTDEDGFLAFARSLRSPALYEAIAEAEPLTPIAGQRATENRLRHYDRLKRFPDGVVAVGDAACAFNPVYGQGMTAAALGAEVLERWLQGDSSRLGLGRGRAFQRELTRATAAAWQLSTGADYRFRTTAGPPQGRVARLIGRYVAGVMRTATRRPWVRHRLADVFHLLRPPSALFGPGVLARVAWDRLAAARPASAPGRLGVSGTGPTRFAESASSRSKSSPPRADDIDANRTINHHAEISCSRSGVKSSPGRDSAPGPESNHLPSGNSRERSRV
jgi:hypothetical protein